MSGYWAGWRAREGRRLGRNVLAGDAYVFKPREDYF